MSNVDQQAMRAGMAAVAFGGDPRLSRQQTQTIDALCATDPDARILGLDEKHRPVVRARVGIPRRVRTWALLRNGDPTDNAKLTEVWR